MDFHLDGLEALEAIVRTGSFSAAARELHKAQSAVSYAIQQLETNLGVSVFDRSGHRAVLTDEGRVVLEEGRMLLASARRIQSLAKQMGTGWEGRLEVVVDGILPIRPIMQVLKRMGSDEVPTQIQVRVEFMTGVQARFDKNDADIMVVNRYQARDNLVSIPMQEVEVVLTCAPDHPLAADAPDQSWTQRELHNFIELSVHDTAEGKDTEDPTMFGGSRVFFLSDFQSKKEALLMGLGFGWMPAYLIKKELDRGDLVEIKYDRGSRYSFTPLLVHRADRPLGRAGRQFIELLTE